MASGTVERAFQLAPDCTTIEQVRAKLLEEGCTRVDDHLRGSLRRDLSKLLNRAANGEHRG